MPLNMPRPEVPTPESVCVLGIRIGTVMKNALYKTVSDPVFYKTLRGFETLSFRGSLGNPIPFFAHIPHEYFVHAVLMAQSAKNHEG
jgi:hypothetical protein